MIEFENVSLTLGQFRLNDVSLRIKKGEFYFVIGPSGAGKTVILEAIAGLHNPDSGRIKIRGINSGSTPPEKRKIGLVYQDYSLFPHMTVYNNIAFGMKMKKMPKHEIRKKVTELLESFQITDLKDRYPLSMSGGEQQRVAIARALAARPEILLLDEPLSALDPITKERFIEDLRQIHRDYNLTIVQVTHGRKEAMRLATRIAVVIDGKLVSEGDGHTIFTKPDSPDVAKFVGIENIIEGVVEENNNQKTKVRTGNVLINCISDYEKSRRVTLCIRADQITLSPAPFKEHPDMQNVFKGTVNTIIPSGPVLELHIGCGFDIIAIIATETAKKHGITISSEIYAGFSEESVHLIPKPPSENVKDP